MPAATHRVHPRPGGRSRWAWLLTITASGWLAVPFAFSTGDLATWIWQGLWAPAAGALAGRMLGWRWAASVPLWWGLAAALGSHGGPNSLAGSAAVAALYLVGFSSACMVRGAWGLAGTWLLLGACLSALPSAGGIWAMAPGAHWLSRALNLSPVVWVCESAGLDWMRHISVYEVAGAGDLGPQERMAWVPGPGLLAVLVLTMVMSALAARKLKRSLALGRSSVVRWGIPVSRVPLTMSAMRKKYFCTFPQALISEPIISHTLGERFEVIPNIRAASISDTMALVAVEIEGGEDAIAESVDYLRERGVKVEEMRDNDELPGA